MHTFLVIGLGLALLAACVFGGQLAGGPDALAKGAVLFLPLWLVGAGVNMYLGVSKAGYTVAEEAPLFLVVFLVPAAVALFLWWRLRA
jgi:hypothetical protein